MCALVCFMVNAFLFALSYFRYRTIFAPTVLLNIIWGLSNLMNLLLGWTSNEYEYLILTLPSLMFTIGFLFSTRAIKTIHVKTSIYNIDQLFYIKKNILKIVLIVELILFAYYMFFIVSKISVYYSGNLWFTLRRIIWFENTDEMLIFKYPSVPIFIMPSLLLISYRNVKRVEYKSAFILSSIIALCWSLISTSRTQTFTFLALTLFSQLLYQPTSKNNELKSEIKQRRRYVVLVTVLMLFVFCYVALLKNGDIYGDVSIKKFVLNSIINYTNLSSACFVIWYKNGFTYTNGSSAFRFIFALLSSVGLDVNVANTSSGGLFITYSGLTSNAFTVARNYVQDYGVLFMAIILCIFGIIHGKMYKYAKMCTGRKNIQYCIFCGVLYVPLMYQILTDQYLNVLSGWIQYFIWIAVLTSKYILQSNVNLVVKKQSNLFRAYNVKNIS